MTNKTETAADRRDRYATAIRDRVRFRLGPSVLALAQQGRAVKMTFGEAETAADAAVAVADAEMGRLRIENERLRHELEVMYGGAFDKPETDERPDHELYVMLRKFGLDPGPAQQVIDTYTRRILARQPTPAPAEERPVCGDSAHRHIGPCTLYATPDVTEEPKRISPAAAVEVRRPCPHCADHQMIPRTQYAEHLARLHPDQATEEPS